MEKLPGGGWFMDGDKKEKIDLKRIPIVIGITGHRDIRKEDEEKLKNAVRDELKIIKDLCPNSNLVMLNSLARGADLLCAGVAMEMKVPLYVVLPMDESIYKREQNFNESDRYFFEECYETAERKFTTPMIEVAPSKDIEEAVKVLVGLSKKQCTKPLDDKKLKIAKDYLYRQAGIYIVSHCHVFNGIVERKY